MKNSDLTSPNKTFLRLSFLCQRCLLKAALIIAFTLPIISSGNLKAATTQVDTLWGANNPTPDSVYYNIFSRPNIVNTYGKEGDNPTLDWDNMAPTERKNYFTQKMKEVIKMFPDTVTSTGDTIMWKQGENCDFYTALVNAVTYGVNNISNETGTYFTKYDDTKQVMLDHVGEKNIPVLETAIGHNSAGESHSTSMVYLKNQIDQNTSLNDFETRDSKTNQDANPGSYWMPNGNDVGVDWYGYRVSPDGSGNNLETAHLMQFKLNADGTSELVYIDPKTITINPKFIELSTTAPKDTVINYSSDWNSKDFGKFVTSTNVDMQKKIHTDDGNNQVDINYQLNEQESLSDTTALVSGAARKYNFKFTRKNIADLVQKGVMTNIKYPNGDARYMNLKKASSEQVVEVRDMEAPTQSGQDTNPVEFNTSYNTKDGLDALVSSSKPTAKDNTPEVDQKVTYEVVGRTNNGSATDVNFDLDIVSIATDLTGNSDTVKYSKIIQDTTPPAGSLEQIAIQANEGEDPLVLAKAQIKNVSDNSGLAVDTTWTHDSDATNDYYDFTLADVSGNSTDLGTVTVAKATTGINDLRETAACQIVSISPNPAHNQARITFTTQTPGEVHFSLLDMSGNTLESFSRNSVTGENTTSLTLSGFTSGHYLLLMTTDNGCRVSQKLVVK